MEPTPSCWQLSCLSIMHIILGFFLRWFANFAMPFQNLSIGWNMPTDHCWRSSLKNIFAIIINIEFQPFQAHPASHMLPKLWSLSSRFSLQFDILSRLRSINNITSARLRRLPKLRIDERSGRGGSSQSLSPAHFNLRELLRCMENFDVCQSMLSFRSCR